MNLQTQDDYTTIAMKGSEVYNDLQEMVSKGQLEKRSGVIILTPDELEIIRRNDYAAGVDWALNTGQKFGEQYEKYLSEYLNEPI